MKNTTHTTSTRDRIIGACLIPIFFIWGKAIAGRSRLAQAARAAWAELDFTGFRTRLDRVGRALWFPLFFIWTRVSGRYLSVEDLDLSGLQVGDREIEDLRIFRNLKRLNLADNRLSDETAEIISYLTSLESLTLTTGGITDHGLALLAERLTN